MLNKFIHFAAQAADATGAAEPTTLVETAYKGTTVPIGATILFGAGLLLLFAGAVAIIVYQRKHVKNWAYPMYAGAIFYLLFSYIVITLLSFGLSFLPEVKEYAKEHDQTAPGWLHMLLYGLRIVTDSLALYLGLRYMRNSGEKRRIEPVIGHAVSFGVACYIAYVLISGALSGYFEFISISGTINSQGFDVVLSRLVEGNPGVDVQKLETYLLSFVQPDIGRVLFSTFVNMQFWRSIPGIWPTMVMLGVYVTSSVLVYGFQIKKLGSKWLIAAFALVALNWIPYIPSAVMDLPAWATGIWYTALLALCVLAFFYVMKHDLSDEFKAFGYSREEEQKKVYRETHKMPKIVMPRDEDLQPVGSKGTDTEAEDEAVSESRKAAEEAFGMTEEEAEALMAEEEAEAASDIEEEPEENGRKEEV